VADFLLGLDALDEEFAARIEAAQSEGVCVCLCARKKVYVCVSERERKKIVFVVLKCGCACECKQTTQKTVVHSKAKC
jgi:hypothetical protein